MTPEAGNATRRFAWNAWDLLSTRAGVALDPMTVRTATAQKTVDARSGAGEPYEPSHDPDEMETLVDDPSAAALRAELPAMTDARPDDRRPQQAQVVRA